MSVTLFFRKAIPGFFSIEKLFQTILPEVQGVDVRQVFMPFKSAVHPAKLLQNLLHAYRYKSEVNHITGEVYYVALALPGKNTILTIHDIESLQSHNKLKNYLLQLLWLRYPVKRVKYITVISEHSRRNLLDKTGIDAGKITVIPNCIKYVEEDFKPKAIAADVPVLLQIGIKQNKNLETLIISIENFPCKLLIVGKLSDVQARLLDDKKVNYENYCNISDERLKELYYRADILTFVSTYEGFGLPILEANALGRPVITSNTTAMPEVAGSAALLVNPLDPAQIRDAIIKLVHDEDLRKQLIANGRENVKRFKPEVIAAQYEALYKRVLSENGRA